LFDFLVSETGNQYGLSNAAYPYYQAIIRNFSPAEVVVLLTLSISSKTIVGNRIKTYRRCWEAYKNLVTLIDPSTVTTAVRSIYDGWLK
jgi:hypothetical protein